MQRVPPIDREFDDRQVDDADQGQERAGARAAAAVVERVHQRDIAEIKEKQHQHRGQPRVPHPPRAPHRPAPERACREADKRETRPDRRRRLTRDLGQRMPPDQRDRARNRDEQIDRQRHPGGRNMDEHDPDRLALLVIGRRHDQRPEQPGGEHQGGCDSQTRQHRPARAHETRRVGKAGQHRAAFLVEATSTPVYLALSRTCVSPSRPRGWKGPNGVETHHSSAWRSAAAVASGASGNAATVTAASSSR